MAEKRPEIRVVMLSGWAEDGLNRLGRALPGVGLVCVASGYEAAAELLAEPASGLVVELGCLTAQHGGLLKLAREQGVEILGMGSFPPGLEADQLSGVRLVSVDDLPDLLGGLSPVARSTRKPAASPESSQTATQAPKKNRTGGLYYVPGDEPRREARS
jgi:hypothetical protein